MDSVTIATLVVSAATLLLVAATLLLWWEARRLRVEANLSAFPAPWELASGLYIAVIVENAGPAVARDVSVEWWLDRKADAKHGVLKEPAYPVGFARTIVPIRSGTKMDELAAEGASVRIEFTWRDGRRRLQHRSVAATCEEVRSGYADSGALPRPSLIEVLSQIRDELKKT